MPAISRSISPAGRMRVGLRGISSGFVMVWSPVLVLRLYAFLRFDAADPLLEVIGGAFVVLC
ncbi:hypothetical protein RQCS_58800 (plasmid) [Rhodococcus qingshengii]|nr:hypothetical protein RQCS_58800 [Rhodococcus qingshengii]